MTQAAYQLKVEMLEKEVYKQTLEKQAYKQKLHRVQAQSFSAEKVVTSFNPSQVCVPVPRHLREPARRHVPSLPSSLP
jgi:hypothetical protein